jgi:hypothetical protein
MTHDYKRHGTTTLFAALNVLDGTVIGRNMQRHRHQEFIRFLSAVEAEVPASKAVHGILDNYAAHKHPKVRQWLDRHERFTFHLHQPRAHGSTPSRGVLRHAHQTAIETGRVHSIFDLQASINRFLKEHNMQSKPFVWTADPDKINCRRTPRASNVRFYPLAARLETTRFWPPKTPKIPGSRPTLTVKTLPRGTASVTLRHHAEGPPLPRREQRGRGEDFVGKLDTQTRN